MNKENRKQSFSLKQRLTIWTGLLSFGILSWGLFMWPGQKKEERYEVRRAEERAEKLKALRHEEAQVLESYGWQDKEAKIARIPIQEAMKLAVERLSKKPVRKGGVIAAAISGGTSNSVVQNVAQPNAMIVTNNPPNTNLLQGNQGMGGAANVMTRTNNTNSIRSDTNFLRSDTNTVRSDTNTVRTNETRRLLGTGNSVITNRSDNTRANNTLRTDPSTRSNPTSKRNER